MPFTGVGEALVLHVGARWGRVERHHSSHNRERSGSLHLSKEETASGETISDLGGADVQGV